MLSSLMLAQAQYLFYKKASDSGMKANVLCKISMQVSEYFKRAYEFGATNASIKQYDNGKFLSVLHYHQVYFLGMSYMIIGQDFFKQSNDTGAGMG